MRAYTIFLAVTFVLALLMSAKNMASAVTMLTLGLGSPMVFAATAFAYGLCLFPMIASWDSRRPLGVALSCAALALLALPPGVLGRMRGEREAAALIAKDHAPPRPVNATSIEIHRPSLRNYDHFQNFMDRDACGGECRSLLLSGQVKWARIITEDGSDGPTSTFYRGMRGADCAVPDEAKQDAARCALMAPDTGEKADLTLVFKWTSLQGRDPAPFALAHVPWMRSFTAFTGAQEEIFRTTEVELEPPVIPLILMPRFHQIESDGLDFVRSELTVNQITLRGALVALGYSIAQPSDAPPVAVESYLQQSVSETMTREMVAVLDLPQTEPFNDPQAKTIADWIMHARNIVDWTPDRLALLRRIVRDPRLRTPTTFTVIFSARPEVASALLPDLLDVIARDGIGNDYTVARQAAYDFPRLDPSLLKPQASRIVALLGKSRSVRDILLPAVGRLGIDPRPYLLPFNADASNARVLGACFAEKQWAPQLIGPLRDAIHAYKGGNGNDDSRFALMFKALWTLGDHAFIDSELATNPHVDARRVRAQINSTVDRDQTDRLCYGW